MATTVAEEQQHYQLEEPTLRCLVEEEEEEEEEENEEVALERRQSQQGFSTGGVPPSSSSTSTSSSPTSMKDMNGNGLGLQVTTHLLDGHPPQKQKQIYDDSVRDEAAQHGAEPEDIELPSDAAGTNREAPQLTFAAAATNGDTSTTGSTTQYKNSVYFDNELGVWKCHHCSWNKRFTGSRSVPNLKFDGHSHMLVDTETVNRCGLLFVSETKGAKTNNALSDIRNGASSMVEYSGESGATVENSEFQNFHSNEVNHHFAKPSNDNGSVGPELSPTVNVYKSNNKDAQNSSVVTRAEADLNTVQVINSELTELDVEAVLEKQETHDLFCPNCNSCITKRVILRKRKRMGHGLDSMGKRDKPEVAVSSEFVNIEASANPGDVPIIAPVVDVSRPVTGSFDPQSEPTSVSEPEGPEVFRCLSCFSFFIPAAGNLFRRGTSELDNVRSSQEEPATNAHWFFSIFKSNKGARTSQQGEAPLERSILDTATKNESSLNTGMSLYPGIGRDVPIAESTIDKNGDAESNKYGKRKLEGITTYVPSISDSSKAVHQAQKDCSSNMASVGKLPLDKEAREFSSDLYHAEDKLSYTTGEGYMPSNVTIGKMEVEDVVYKRNTGDSARQTQHEGSDFSQSSFMELDESSSSVNQKPQPGESYFPESSTNGSLAPQQPENGTYQKPSKDVDEMESVQSASAVTGEMQVSNGVSDQQNINMDPTVSTADQITVVHKVNISPGEKINTAIESNKTGGDVIVTVESSSSQGADNCIISETATLEPSSTQVHILGQRNIEAGESYKLDILKSVVYGGLIESITSLGIVSSAVGGGAAPLNIVALGLANLVGGLLILVDNLLELKIRSSSEDHQQVTAKEDRYQELLGHRANFGFHITLAILSFLIFGSVPLAMYGFLAHKNYKTVITIAAVLAVSLLCIIFLASARVYTKKQPKSYIKTVSHYVTMAVAASGISYIVGDLVRDLLEKFNQPQTGLNIITGFLDDTANVKPTWSSY